MRIRMEANRQSPLITLTAALGLLIPSFIGLRVAPGPTILPPLPLLTVIPTMFIGDFGLLVPTILFLLWCPQLFRAQGRIPTRTYLRISLATR